MGKLFDELAKDIHLQDGLNACINCGTCTAICPAADFYNYDPRQIVDIVQNKDDNQIEELLKSDTIWYCGECMSCRTRCPRNNAPGLIIIALRNLSQEKGYFIESEKGRQQLYIKRTIGQNILNTGYCLFMEGVGTDEHPEQGPIWDWRQQNWADVMERLGANYQKEGSGAMRKIPHEALKELNEIFKVTGGHERFERIEYYSAKKAKEMGFNPDKENNNDYVRYVNTTIEKDHHSRTHSFTK